MKSFQIFSDPDTFQVMFNLDITSYFSGFVNEMLSRVFTILIKLKLVIAFLMQLFYVGLLNVIPRNK